jgi:hypothetical protein
MCNFSQLPVIPAKAGIHFFGSLTIPETADSCFRRNDKIGDLLFLFKSVYGPRCSCFHALAESVFCDFREKFFQCFEFRLFAEYFNIDQQMVCCPVCGVAFPRLSGLFSDIIKLSD